MMITGHDCGLIQWAGSLFVSCLEKISPLCWFVHLLFMHIFQIKSELGSVIHCVLLLIYSHKTGPLTAVSDMRKELLPNATARHPAKEKQGLKAEKSSCLEELQYKQRLYCRGC